MLLSAMHVDIFSTLCLVISKGASPMPGVEPGEERIWRNWSNTNAHRATEAKSLIGLIDGQLVLHVPMLKGYSDSQKPYPIIYRPQI